MAKSSSLAALHAQRSSLAESKPRKRNPDPLARRVGSLGTELANSPVKPLLVGMGIGAALLGIAVTVTSKRRSPFSGMNPALTKTALVAVARVISGQTVRSAATSALLDIADDMKR